MDHFSMGHLKPHIKKWVSVTARKLRRFGCALLAVCYFIATTTIVGPVIAGECPEGQRGEIAAHHAGDRHIHDVNCPHLESWNSHDISGRQASRHPVFEYCVPILPGNHMGVTNWDNYLPSTQVAADQEIIDIYVQPVATQPAWTSPAPPDKIPI